MGDSMELVPASIGRVSRAWDEQHLDLQAAARQVGRAPQGFSPAVTGAAQRFGRAWEQHLGRAATLCEIRADGLRDAMADQVATDGIAAAAVLGLLPYLEEVR